MSENTEKPPSDQTNAPLSNEDSDRPTASSETFEVPDLVVPAAAAVPGAPAVLEALVGSGTLDRLVDTAKDYARQATADNTNAAYKADWAHFTSWCRRRGWPTSTTTATRAAGAVRTPCPHPMMAPLPSLSAQSRDGCLASPGSINNAALP